MIDVLRALFTESQPVPQPALNGQVNLWPKPTLSLLSYNMMAGMHLHHPLHYLTRGHRLVFGNRHQEKYLHELASLLAEFDIVGLQEVDAGSLRSHFTHQLAHLAHHAKFPYWFLQKNRDLGRFGQFSNGLLAHTSPRESLAFELPGIKGRGLILSHFGTPEHPLSIVNTHLALGARVRAQQLDFIFSLTKDLPYVIILGDLNCKVDELKKSALWQRAWQTPVREIYTYPSWQPRRQIDHILVSEGMDILSLEKLPALLSDHSPLAITIQLPKHFHPPA
jgi:endonuclease/exonuclease/phosphatase family metal-dependent hydrolase